MSAPKTISRVLDELIALESALTITEPIRASVTKAYPFLPPAAFELPGPRCWFNGFSMQPFRVEGSERHLIYDIRAQMLCAPSNVDTERQFQVALSFWEEFQHALFPIGVPMDDVYQAITLNGAVSLGIVLRGAMPETVTGLDYGGKNYIGIDAYIEAHIEQPWGI